MGSTFKNTSRYPYEKIPSSSVTVPDLHTPAYMPFERGVKKACTSALQSILGQHILQKNESNSVFLTPHFLYLKDQDSVFLRKEITDRTSYEALEKSTDIALTTLHTELQDAPILVEYKPQAHIPDMTWRELHSTLSSYFRVIIDCSKGQGSHANSIRHVGSSVFKGTIKRANENAKPHVVFDRTLLQLCIPKKIFRLVHEDSKLLTSTMIQELNSIIDALSLTSDPMERTSIRGRIVS